MFGLDGEIKLIDLGLAKQTVLPNQTLHTVAGTPYFIAPEVLKGAYGKECDIWSLGVIFFNLITGVLPFEANTQAALFTKIKSGGYTFPKSAQGKVSTECIDLISKMLTVDKGKRITAE